MALPRTNKTDALEAIQGCLLGDAGLSRQNEKGLARFTLALSGGDHIDWLRAIKRSLLALGVPVSDIYPKVGKATSRGKQYTYCKIQSRMHPLLLEMCLEWYAAGVKNVPGGLALTPVVVANWFMGDGSLFYNCGVLRAKFATHCFSGSDVERLSLMLAELGVVMRLYKQNSKFYLTTNRRVHAERLKDLVEPYVVPSYGCKIGRV